MTIFKRLKNIKESLDAIKKFWKAKQEKTVWGNLLK